MILYVVFYFICSVKLLGRKDKKVIDITKYIKMWIVALVPLLGVFGYFYMESTATLAILFWLILGMMTRRVSVHKNLMTHKVNP